MCATNYSNADLIVLQPKQLKVHKINHTLKETASTCCNGY